MKNFPRAQNGLAPALASEWRSKESVDLKTFKRCFSLFLEDNKPFTADNSFASPD